MNDNVEVPISTSTKDCNKFKDQASSPSKNMITSKSAQYRKVGYVFEEKFLWHSPWGIQYTNLVQPYPHWESPDTKRRIHNLLHVTGLIHKLHHLPLPCNTSGNEGYQGNGTQDENIVEQFISLNHTTKYVNNVQQISTRVEGGIAGEEVPISQHAYEIARLAVMGVLRAVDAVMEGTVQNAYALVRPPGHHALSDCGMGFCIFNNVAIAGKYLLQNYGSFDVSLCNNDDVEVDKKKVVRKIAIVDYDVHHGNGTQDSFYEDDKVLFISIHQDRNYPSNSGMAEETGRGKGEGTTINIPLPPGSGKGAYAYALDRVVEPALLDFDPDFILVSSGFDASFQDSTAAMILSSDDFRAFASRLIEVAENKCHGRIVFVHEGGYSELYVPFCTVAVMEELLGIECTGRIKDPFLMEVNNWGGQELQAHQKSLIDQVRNLHQINNNEKR